MEKVKQQCCLAEIEVTYKPRVKTVDMHQIKSSKDAEIIFRSIWSPTLALREEFYFLLLNRNNKVLGWYRLSEGGISGTVADIRLLFSIALKGNACAIIIAHNHPSGNLNPSDTDRNLTKTFAEAGKLLEIHILDHLIITLETYVSFSDEGWL